MKKKIVLIIQRCSFYGLAGLWLILATCPAVRAATYSSSSDPIKVSGRVTSSDGTPLPGVNVVVKGSPSIGTVTDANGHYKLSVPNSNDVLEFSYIGYITKVVSINGRSTLNVELSASAQSLNELVVTGYMTQKKADLTGAVSVVSADEIAKSHGSTNVLNALQGKVPGMYITTDGDPTQGVLNVQVRGLTSVNGAPPLVVIDGVPAPGFNFRDLNANNIASMQVLKDAYSASIYGAQGAGGVILIETKKGAPGKTTVTYNGTVGFSMWMNKPKMLNTQQYGLALGEAAINDAMKNGLNPDPNLATQIYTYQWHKNAQGWPIIDQVTPIKQFNDTMASANTNWLDAISQLGLQTDHQITVSGGNEKATSLLSLDYFNNDGYIKYTGYDRFTVRLNTNYKMINDHFNIGENLAVSRLNMSTQCGNCAVHDAMVEPPIIPVHTKNGGWGGSAVHYGMDDYWNPVRGLTENANNRNKYNKIIGDVYANAYFLKHFTLHTQLGLIYTEGYHRTIQFTFTEGGGKLNDISSVDQWYWWEANEDWTNTLDYKLHFGKSDIDALVGMEANKYTTETMDANRQDLAFQNYDFAYVGSATGNIGVGGSGDKYTFLSYFGKVNYVYDSKYLLSGSIREDGSSKFGANNQFGLFPAISAGWKINQEKFMQSVPAISDLKLRASWGVNGNSNIPTASTETYFLTNYNYTSYAIRGGGDQGGITIPSGYYRQHTGNPNLKWETSKQTDIGVDFGFFNQRLTGSIDYYRKATNGMLFQPPYLGTEGEGAYEYYNAADMTDRGAELEISYQSNPNKKFQWSISGNISHNHNIVTHVPVNVLYGYGGSPQKGDSIDGHPLDSYYGFIAEGIFKTQKEVDNAPPQAGYKGLGRIQYKDISGPDGKPDDTVGYTYDQTWLGSWDPKVTFGVTFNASWKNFDFYMFWQGVAGSTVYDGWKGYSDFWNVFVQKGFNHPARILNAWSPTNPNSNIPSLFLVNQNDELRLSTYFLESGDYLKLRNIQIGYTLPHRLTSKLDMQKFRIYIMAQNLVQLKKWWGKNAYTGPDPELANNVDPQNLNGGPAYFIPLTCKTGIDVTF